MTYATVMVNLSLHQSNRPCLSIARELAGRLGARVIGIAAAALSPPLYFTDGPDASTLLATEQRALEKGLSELEGQFSEGMRNQGIEFEWRSSLEIPARYIAQQARAADLIVTGSGETAGISDPFAAAAAGDLLMLAGRPLLITPQIDWFDTRSAIVAWKDGPEARRAIMDALPLLRLAKDVIVVEVLENDSDRIAAQARTQDVVGWLSRHGVTAGELVPEPIYGGNAAAEIGRIASQARAGVVIAGGYAHSRFREWVFGGVTRSLIEGTERCALLSR